MKTLNHAAGTVAPVLAFAAMVLCASTAAAQSATQNCRPAQIIPLTGTEPAAKIAIEPPLPAPLASRGVVVIPYCAENMHLAPVFGAGALAVSPRVGHIHVTVGRCCVALGGCERQPAHFARAAARAAQGAD